VAEAAAIAADREATAMPRVAMALLPAAENPLRLWQNRTGDLHEAA